MSSLARLAAIGAATLTLLAAGCAGRPAPAPAGPLAADGGDRGAPAPRPEEPGAAGAPAPVDLSAAVDLTALYEAAFRENPKLRAARHRWQATIEKIPIETALPDPEFGYSYGVQPTETRTGPMRHKAMVRQMIPFPTKLILRGEVVEEEVRIARHEFEIATRDVLSDLQDAYYELVWLDQSRRVTLENQDFLRKLVAHVTSEHAADRAQFMEVQRAQSMLAQLEYDLVTLAELEAVQKTRLNAILSRPPSSAIGTPAPLPAPGGVAVDLDTLYAEAEAHLQELRRDEARIARSDKQVELARQAWFPDFTLGLDYAETGPPIEALKNTPDAGMDDIYAFVGIRVPIWLQKNSAGVRKALAERSAAVAERESDLDQATARIAKAYFRMRNAARLVRLYAETLLPQAAHGLATSRELYEAGDGSYSHVLELQQVDLNYRLALSRAVSDYYQALAQLERSVGRPLPEIVEILEGGDGR